MKKRVQCLIMAMLLLATCFITSCGNQEDVDTLTFDEGTKKSPAMTVTIWGIKGENTTDEAVKLVEDAMSAVTQAEFNTALQLNLFTYDEYKENLEVRLEEIAEQKKLEQAEADQKKAVAMLYKNNKTEESSETIPEDETSVNEIGIVEIIYPEPDPSQLDIFFVPDYDTFVEYQEDGHLSALDVELGSTGKLMKTYIHPNILSASKLGGATYSVINNKPIGQYTYMLLNKELLDKYYYDVADIPQFANADAFIMDVAANEPGIVPVYDDFEPLGIQYFTKDGAKSVVGSIVTKPKGSDAYGVPRIIFKNNDFLNHTKQLKKYQSLGYVGDGTAEIGKFAVGVVNGNAADVAKYADKYEIVVLQNPRVDNTVYSNMFAISTYTKDITRSMEVLCALNTNPELRNIFAYGIKDVHYTLDADGVVRTLNNDYDTPLEYTGNMFLAYPPEGASPDIWDNCKAQNLEIVDDPFFGFFHEDEVEEELMDEVARISEKYFAELDAVPYTQFDAWVEKAIAELTADPTITKYTSFEDEDGLAYAYNEWFFALYPNAMA